MEKNTFNALDTALIKGFYIYTNYFSGLSGHCSQGEGGGDTHIKVTEVLVEFFESDP